MPTAKKATRFVVGQEIRFEYPAQNRFGIPLEYVIRRAKILEVRDTADFPIPSEDLLHRPLDRRGSVLLVSHDLDLDQRRDFWVEAIRPAGRRKPELPGYRLGLYDPEENDELVDWLNRTFRPTAKDRLSMRETILEYERKIGETNLTLAGFSVE